MDSGRKRACSDKAGPSKKTKVHNVFNKESFLKSIKGLRLYVEGDKYYEIKPNQGPLVLDWK